MYRKLAKTQRKAKSLDLDLLISKENWQQFGLFSSREKNLIEANINEQDGPAPPPTEILDVSLGELLHPGVDVPPRRLRVPHKIRQLYLKRVYRIN